MGSQEDIEEDGIKEPLMAANPSTGGFRTLPFIIGSVALGIEAACGVDSNMIIYLTKGYGMEMATGSNIINLWKATTYFVPVLAAFLADSYINRFRVIGFGCIINTLGMMMLWSTSMIPGARPSCDHDLSPNSCTAPTLLQLILLFSSFGLLSVGAAGAIILAFGADQLTSNPGDGLLERFFNWYFIIQFSSLILAQTSIVYIQDHMGWKIGLGVPFLLMVLSAITFFMGSSLYIKLEPKASLLTGFVQVFVAAWRNRHYELPSHESNTETWMYHVVTESRFDMPSDKLRFLNKACFAKHPRQDLTSDGTILDSWRVCTVDQVEELKSVINIIPLWSTGIILNVNASQASFRVIQANSMNRHVFASSFEIPAASFGFFAILTTILWLALYDRVILPLASKVMGKSIRLNVKTRMGIGLIISIISLVVAAVVESVRLEMATKGRDSQNGDASSITPMAMSALWLLPQICLLGLAEGFMITAQNEFFYSELPKSMSSIASTLYSLGMAMAGLVASLIVIIVNSTTRRGGEDSWLSTDPNKGHYDYYYWVLTGLCLLNYIYFLLCCRAYDQGKIK